MANNNKKENKKIGKNKRKCIKFCEITVSQPKKRKLYKKKINYFETPFSNAVYFFYYAFFKFDLSIMQ